MSIYGEKKHIYVDYRASIDSLYIDCTVTVPSADLPYWSFSVVGTHNQSRTILHQPHRNRIDHPRIRRSPIIPTTFCTTLKTTIRASCPRIAYIVCPFVSISTSIRPLRGLMRDGPSHAALRFRFSLLSLGPMCLLILPHITLLSLCHPH